MELRETLAALRKEHGLSQAELAEELGVTRQAISRWETGAASPTTDNLICLSQLFDVTMDELVKGRKEVDITPAEMPPAVRDAPEANEPKKVEQQKRIWRKWIIIGFIVIGIFVIIEIWGAQTNSPLAAKLLQLLVAFGLLAVAAVYILYKVIAYYLQMRKKKNKNISSNILE